MSVIFQLQRDGATSLELLNPEDRICRECEQPYIAYFIPQSVCYACVEKRRNDGFAPARQQDHRTMMLQNAGLSGDQLTKTCENFVSSEQPEAHAAAMKFLLRWPKSGGLLFHGENGCGKSHLAIGILRRLLDQGHEGKYWFVPDLSHRLKVAPDWQEAARGWIEPLFFAPVLILDDYGREAKSEAFVEALDAVIEKRTIHGRPTIITANLSPSEVQRWMGKASASRFFGSAEPVAFRPGDRRLDPIEGMDDDNRF